MMRYFSVELNFAKPAPYTSDRFNPVECWAHFFTERSDMHVDVPVYYECVIAVDIVKASFECDFALVRHQSS